MSETRVLHALVTEGAHAVWRDTADDAGVTVTAFLEAIALDMAAHPPEEGGHPRWEELTRAARKIDAANRRKHGRRSG